MMNFFKYKLYYKMLDMKYTMNFYKGQKSNIKKTTTPTSLYYYIIYEKPKE